MPREAWQHLTYRHAHPRDAHISFDEPTHKYYVNGSCVGNISCTGFVHEFFGHFDAKAILTKFQVDSWKSWTTRYLSLLKVLRQYKLPDMIVYKKGPLVPFYL